MPTVLIESETMLIWWAALTKRVVGDPHAVFASDKIFFCKIVVSNMSASATALKPSKISILSINTISLGQLNFGLPHEDICAGRWRPDYRKKGGDESYPPPCPITDSVKKHQE